MNLYRNDEDDMELICTLTSDINKCWIGDYPLESYLYHSDIGVYFIRIPGMTIGIMKLNANCEIKEIKFTSDILDNFTDELSELAEIYKGQWVNIKPI